jgi:hypothetical protein
VANTDGPSRRGPLVCLGCTSSSPTGRTSQLLGPSSEPLHVGDKQRDRKVLRAVGEVHLELLLPAPVIQNVLIGTTRSKAVDDVFTGVTSH